MIDKNLPIKQEFGYTEIQFAEETKDPDDAYVLSKAYGNVSIGSDDNLVYIDSKEDAEMLIKALQKALNEGWWD